MEFIGGQAVIEGVMMRNGDNVAVAVLNPEGKIILKKERYNFLNLKIPFIRGMVSLVEVLYVGLKTLNYSSNIAVGGTEEKKKIGVFSMIFSTLFALVLAIGLFNVFKPTYNTSTRLTIPLINGILRFKKLYLSFFKIILPSGSKTATATLSPLRIITPSITACPPTNSIRNKKIKTLKTYLIKE